MKKTASQKLAEHHQIVAAYAEKIANANYTMDRDAELREFTMVTWHVAPFEIAMYAASMVLDGFKPLSWFPPEARA